MAGCPPAGRTVAIMRLFTFVLVIALALTAATTAAARAGPWQRPVDGTVLRSFGLSADRYARGQHRGVDLQAPLGSTVRAACGGHVTFAGRLPGGGRTVSVRCGPLIATYQQLGRIDVRRGQTLAPGASLATVGRSMDPRTRRPHLHLGAREAATGRYVDPLSLLGNAGRPAPLLPPASRPARRPVPLGPAPARPLAQPEARRVHVPAPVLAPARAAAPHAATPWTVWAGLLCVGLGLPLGGLVSVRRSRHRRRHAATSLAHATS